MIHDYFRVTGARGTVLGCADLFSITLCNDNDYEISTPETRKLRQEQWLRVTGDQVVLKEKKEFAVSGRQKGSVQRKPMQCPARE